MDELAAEGVSFPIHMDLWASSSQSNQNALTVLKESLEDGLGTDFLEAELHTYITSRLSEVYSPSYMSVEAQGFGADYCDPMTYLNELCDDNDGNAAYADMYGHFSECDNPSIIDQVHEYTEMVRAADAITGDKDAGLEALAEAEAFAINHCLVFPLTSGVSRMITSSMNIPDAAV